MALLPKSITDKLNDKNWLSDQYITQRKSSVEISRMFGIHYTTVMNYIRNHGISRKDRHCDAFSKLDNKNWLETEYISKRRKIKEIAETLRVGERTVISKIRKHGINLTRHDSMERKSPEIYALLDNKDWLLGEVSKLSIRKIAKNLKISDSIILRYCRKFNIETSLVSNKSMDKLKDKNWLVKEYSLKKRSTKDISSELNISISTLLKYLRKHQIYVGIIDEETQKKLNNRGWLKKEYKRNNGSTVDVSKKLNVSRALVLSYFKKYGFKIRPKRILSKSSLKKLKNRNWLNDQLNTLGREYNDVADELDCGPGVVRKYCLKNNIDVPRGISNDSENKLNDRGWMKDQYFIQKKSVTEIAKNLNVSKGLIYNRFAQNNLILDNVKIEKSIYEKLNDKDWLIENYLVKNKSASEISKDLKTTVATVLSYCRKFNLKIKRTYKRSLYEKEISNYIQSLGVKTSLGCWGLLPNREIDIFVRDHNFGIELNGLYWHSYNPFDIRRRGNNDIFRHLIKTRMAKDCGISLIQITDYEWHNKKDLVKGLICDNLKLNKLHKLFVGEVVRINKDRAEKFFEDNHLRGFISGDEYFGIFDNNIMKFSFVIERESLTDIRILRMTSLGFYSFDDGFDITMLYFKKYNINIKIESDNAIGRDKLYLKNGFEIIKKIDPDYVWTRGPDYILKDNAPFKSDNAMFQKRFGKYYDCGKNIYRRHAIKK